MWPMVDDGSIDPVIAAEVPFAEASKAHDLLTGRHNIGKVVLVP
jgi:NADPH:quinone reductase-like Zn-dependent oxidoreductase